MNASTRRNPWTLVFTAIAVVLIGCAVGVTRSVPLEMPMVTRAPAPQPAAQAVRIVGGPRLPHDKHLELGLECADCHELDDAGVVGYPEVDFCNDCHEEMEEDEEVPQEQRVGTVFFTPDGTPRWQKAILSYDADVKFAHGPHVAAEVACAVCHGDMAGTQRRAQRPYTMAGCMQCHQEKGASLACQTCHVRTRQNVAPPNHAMAWEARHGPAVRTTQAGGLEPTCHYCHTQPAFCNDCHFKQLPSSHAFGWEIGHGRRVLSAGGPGEARCTFCHQDQSFCDDCHMSTQPSSHKHLWIRRHGTMVRTQGVSGEARCAFCHDQPTFCESCHRDMHPRDHTTLFRTKTHGLVASLDRTRCMICHQTDFCIQCHEYTAPRSHRGQWARGRNTHCVSCHLPLPQNCAVCHKGVPQHDMAPDQPPGHNPNSNCRACHFPGGPGGLPHFDNGAACQSCHH